MSDGEAPTPRMTAQWELNAGLAAGLRERLRTQARVFSMPSVQLDTGRASALADMSCLADHYRRRFEAWSKEPVAIEQKSREQRAFSLLVQLAAVELES